MNKRTNKSPKEEWIQYKNNLHIQKNSVTKEFRCKTCNRKLGDNPGGVALHCRSSHSIKIDGSPLHKEKNDVRLEQKPVLRQESQSSLAYRRLFCTKSEPSSVPNYAKDDSFQHFSIPDYQYRPPSFSHKDEFEEKKELWEKYLRAKKDHVPEKFLEILQKKLGLTDYEIARELKREQNRVASKILDLFEELLRRGLSFEDAQYACILLYANKQSKLA